MSWTWRYLGADGGELTDLPGVSQPAHANQSDAESWMGEFWRDLADAGVAQVTLLEDDSESYTMSLDAG
ncbi:hypothetical protein [uncultured Jatrophihabitans sp.]|uniref:hypothetical protein n=1 Tax=uncultured Jatrophihabitans sp. TaxID=1610747 RepID=UPI0035CC9AFB